VNSALKSFRFIHTGDIHLDSPLKGLTGQQGSAAERIRTATRAAFDNLITEAIEEQVAFVIIAGDLYDGDWRDFQTGLFFVRQMGRLAHVGISAFLLYGNHDAESQITRSLVLPDNVRVFSARRPETILMDRYDVAVHGQSFRERDMTDNLVPDYPDPIAGRFNIGVLHTGLGGHKGHANYAPCTIDDLVHKGYDYWALAHVHNRVILHKHPHLAFCGNLQGRQIRENGPKGALLVTIDGGQVESLSLMPVDVVRWTRLHVSVEECANARDVVDCICRTIEDAVVREAEGRLLACRIELIGCTELHGELQTSTEHLLAEARAGALGLGEDAAWIERLVISTSIPEAQASHRDALGDLQRLLERAGQDRSLEEQIETDLSELIRKLPHEVRADLEDEVIAAAIKGDSAGLIRLGGAYLTARLSAGSL
jgi:DNA repair exonuclease SbcCD nuclease subunit